MELQTPPLTPEQRLLLGLLSSNPAEGAGDAGLIQWDDFLRLADGLGLSPFLAYLLQEDSHGFPESARARVLERGRANAMQQLRRHAALHRIAASLEEAHIPLIVLKGMALAYLAYPTPHSRFMSDIDLLVPDSDLEESAERVRALGFVEPRDVDLMERFRPAAARRECFALKSSDGQVQVELHSSLSSLTAFGIASDSLWGRSVPAGLGGVPARTLSPEDFVQHLCLHMGPYHHYLSRLQGLLDLRLYLERRAHGMDWQVVSDRSLQNGSSAWVSLTLWLAQELLGAPVPAAFFQACPAPDQLADASRLATQHLLCASEVQMASSFVRFLAARSFRERGDALAEHWRNVGSRLREGTGGRTRLSWAGDYFRFALNRMRSYVRAGALRPSARSAAAEYQASSVRLLRLMESESRTLPSDPRVPS